MTEDFKRKLTAILSADVVGYSRLMGDDEEATVRTLNNYKQIIFNLIEKNDGRVIDSPGDNVLAEFVSVVDAVRCGVQIQEDLKGHNDELSPDRKMEFRIGIHTGDVIQDGERIYGDGVNVAARIESLADEGGICISSIAYEQVKKKLNFEYEHLGEYEVKNIDDPVSVYKVLMVSKASEKKVEEKKIRSGASSVRKIAIILVIILAILLVWKFYPSKPEVQAPKTIAVLPFDDLSPEKDQEYFVLGLSEEILNSLAQITNLSVIAKTSSFSFKGSNKKIQEIANELGVDYILEGSVRKAGNSIRITAQLIKAVDGSHIWSKTYNRELEVKKMFAVQEDIATAVVDKLKLTLGVAEAIKELGDTNNVEAYENYLIAKGQLSKRADKQSLESINKAVELDPSFALAWALKGIIHLTIKDSIDAGLEAALRAIEIEPDLGEAWITLGSARTAKGEFMEAEKAYQKGLELKVELKDYFEYGLTYHYTTVGYLKKSKDLLEEARRNNPQDPFLRMGYLTMLGRIGDTKGAEKEYERAKAIFGDTWIIGDWAIFIIRLGAKDDFSINDVPESFRSRIASSKIYQAPEEALERFRNLYSSTESIDNFTLESIVFFGVYLGDTELALSALEKSVNINAAILMQVWLPLCKEIRQHPRFKELVREIGLVDYWKLYGWPDLCHPVGDDDFECE